MANSRTKKLLAHGDLTRVANVAGCSKTSVSLFIKDPESVRLSKKTKSKIISAIGEVRRLAKDEAREQRKRIAKLLKQAEAA